MDHANPVFIPGPTNMPEALRRAVDMPTMDHRGPDFGAMLARARRGVARVVQHPGAEVLLFPATGTGGWEIALTNTLRPGDRVLACRNGMFSARWIEMCQRLGLEVEVVEAAWGAGIPAQDFARILEADRGHRIRAVLATHNETATGVRADIAAVRRAMDAASHPALLMVDGVSSIASMEFRMQEWGVDIAVTGSQKGFMLPAGLAILALSERAMAAAQEAAQTGGGLPRAYFDIAQMHRACAGGGYPYTPPAGLVNGLALACDMLLEEGLPQVFARHAHIAAGVRAAVQAWGLPLCAEAPPLYSDTVSAIRLPEGVDGNALVAHAAARYGMAFGTGLGQLAGRVFRIGHLGRLTEAQALCGLATAEMVLADCGVPLQLGAGVAAAQQVYRAGQPDRAQVAAQ